MIERARLRVSAITGVSVRPARAAFDAAVRQIAENVPGDAKDGIDAATLARLAAICRELWRAVDAALPADARHTLSSLAGR